MDACQCAECLALAASLASQLFSELVKRTYQPHAALARAMVLVESCGAPKLPILTTCLDMLSRLLGTDVRAQKVAALPYLVPHFIALIVGMTKSGRAPEWTAKVTDLTYIYDFDAWLATLLPTLDKVHAPLSTHERVATEAFDVARQLCMSHPFWHASSASKRDLFARVFDKIKTRRTEAEGEVYDAVTKAMDCIWYAVDQARTHRLAINVTPSAGSVPSATPSTGSVPSAAQPTGPAPSAAQPTGSAPSADAASVVGAVSSSIDYECEARKLAVRLQTEKDSHMLLVRVMTQIVASYGGAHIDRTQLLMRTLSNLSDMPRERDVAWCAPNAIRPFVADLVAMSRKEYKHVGVNASVRALFRASDECVDRLDNARKAAGTNLCDDRIFEMFHAHMTGLWLLTAFWSEACVKEQASIARTIFRHIAQSAPACEGKCWASVVASVDPLMYAVHAVRTGVLNLRDW